MMVIILIKGIIHSSTSHMAYGQFYLLMTIIRPISFSLFSFFPFYFKVVMLLSVALFNAAVDLNSS